MIGAVRAAAAQALRKELADKLTAREKELARVSAACEAFRKKLEKYETEETDEKQHLTEAQARKDEFFRKNSFDNN